VAALLNGVRLPPLELGARPSRGALPLTVLQGLSLPGHPRLRRIPPAARHAIRADGVELGRYDVTGAGAAARRPHHRESWRRYRGRPVGFRTSRRCSRNSPIRP
jgi:hypothetical protein